MRRVATLAAVTLYAVLVTGCGSDGTGGIFPSSVEGDVRYSVTIESLWSSTTHPADFPANAHYSLFVVTTHRAGTTFWQPGALASPGVRSIAETGLTSPLDAEVAGAIGSVANQLIIANQPSATPGITEFTIGVEATHPLVTFVSMLAPSPDWFVGVSGLDLRPNGTWVDVVSVDLYAYDAGTDSGTTYTSPNSVTTPFVPVFRIEESPFLVNSAVVPVGRATLTLR